MRITDVRVDGYGVLSDLHIKDLPPGLTVLYGPNEAGKSTLLDFLRGVLFGFSDRRARHAFHEPLHGGRHGGALTIMSDDGRRLLLERHVRARHPVLSSAEGLALDEAELRRLLGGADDALFRTVFAFGLNELSSLEALDRDEIRDVVFSAGVLGAGRSATRAARAFDARRAILVRPRQQDAVANQLQRRLEELERQLRVARMRAEHYPRAAADCARLQELAHDARQKSEQAHRRTGELHRVLSCWPTWRRREQAHADLRALAVLDEQTTRLLAQEVEIRHLSGELSGYEERLRNRAERDRQLAGINQSLQASLAGLGEHVDLARLAPIGPEHEAHVAALVDARLKRRAELGALEDETTRLQTESELAQAELERASQVRAVLDDSKLDKAFREAEELRALCGARERLENELSATERERALQHLAQRQQIGIGQRPLLLGASLTATAMILAVLGAARHLLVLSALGMISVVLVLVTLALLAGRAHKRHLAPGPLDMTRSDDLSHLNEQITRLATRFSLRERPQAAEVETVLSSLAAERGERRHLDELQEACDKAAQRLEQATDRCLLVSRALRELDQELDDEAERFGVKGQGGPRLAEYLGAIKEAQALQSARQRVEFSRSELGALIAEFDQRLLSVLKAVGLEQLIVEETSQIALSLLDERLSLAQAQLAQRSELERAIAGADGDLLEALGTGDDARRLLDEIAQGRILAWEQEQRDLAQLVSSCDEAYEQAIAALTSAERELVQVRDSDEIAILEIERESVSAELDQALERWTVLGLAKSLLEQTLERYEKERQPAVIARAAELFAKVTSGRYQQLVARDESDSGRRHGLEAISASGERVDSAELSRGTAEQLYLCLRLAFATTFAERSLSLPLVLDDVLVNFDPLRARAVAEAIAVTAQEHQVLAFTCHPHVLEYFTSVAPELRLVRLERSGQSD